MHGAPSIFRNAPISVGCYLVDGGKDIGRCCWCALISKQLHERILDVQEEWCLHLACWPRWLPPCALIVWVVVKGLKLLLIATPIVGEPLPCLCLWEVDQCWFLSCPLVPNESQDLLLVGVGSRLEGIENPHGVDHCHCFLIPQHCQIHLQLRIINRKITEGCLPCIIP
jgi:hypothetical protein